MLEKGSKAMQVYFKCLIRAGLCVCQCIISRFLRPWMKRIMCWIVQWKGCLNTKLFFWVLIRCLCSNLIEKVGRKDGLERLISKRHSNGKFYAWEWAKTRVVWEKNIGLSAKLAVFWVRLESRPRHLGKNWEKKLTEKALGTSGPSPRLFS